MKSLYKRIPGGITCLAIIILLFGYLGHVMGTANMLNTIMKTAHSLLLNTVFYLMGMCVITGALGKIFTEFGVVDLLQKLLRPIMRPLYNLPGVAVLGCVMTFLSDNPAIISLVKNKGFARFFKLYEYISLANFGTAFGMGMLVIVFMVGQGYFGAPFIGLFGAACGGMIATRLQQHFILRLHPEFRDMPAIESPNLKNSHDDEVKKEDDKSEKDSTFVRILNALLDGGKGGVEIGLAIIPGVLIICTLVMMLTFGGSVEGQDAAGNDIIVYTGAAYQGCELLPHLAEKISFAFHWLFGFTAPELIAFPITALGAVGAALSLIPEFTSKGLIDGNVVAVFTAMGMCWSGFLSTHTAMLDTMGYRHLLPRDILSQITGGICAGIIAHWLYVAITAVGTFFAPQVLWTAQPQAYTCLSDDSIEVQITALDDKSYIVHDWYGIKGTDLSFSVNRQDSTIQVTNAYAQKNGEYYFVQINPKAHHGEANYAVVYPVKQYSEFDGNEKNGCFYTFNFIYDSDHREINRGFYELTWGGRSRQTVEAEEGIQEARERLQKEAEQMADSILKAHIVDSILQSGALQ